MAVNERICKLSPPPTPVVLGESCYVCCEEHVYVVITWCSKKVKVSPWIQMSAVWSLGRNIFSSPASCCCFILSCWPSFNYPLSFWSLCKISETPACAYLAPCRVAGCGKNKVLDLQSLNFLVHIAFRIGAVCETSNGTRAGVLWGTDKHKNASWSVQMGVHVWNQLLTGVSLSCAWEVESASFLAENPVILICFSPLFWISFLGRWECGWASLPQPFHQCALSNLYLRVVSSKYCGGGLVVFCVCVGGGFREVTSFCITETIWHCCLDPGKIQLISVWVEWKWTRKFFCNLDFLY